MQSSLKNKSAITLVALAVTIIVMLILASVAIAVSFGENGLITKVKNAEAQSNKQKLKEQVGLLITEAKNKAEMEGDKYNYEYFLRYIKAKQNPIYGFNGSGIEEKIYLKEKPDEEENLKEIYREAKHEIVKTAKSNFTPPDMLRRLQNDTHLTLNVKGEIKLDQERLIPYVDGVEGILYIIDGNGIGLESMHDTIIIDEISGGAVQRVEFKSNFIPDDGYLIDKQDINKDVVILKREVAKAKANNKKAIIMKSEAVIILAFLEKGIHNVTFANHLNGLSIFKTENIFMELKSVGIKYPRYINANKISAKPNQQNVISGEFALSLHEPDNLIRGRQQVEISDDFLDKLTGLKGVRIGGTNISPEKIERILNGLKDKSGIEQISHHYGFEIIPQNVPFNLKGFDNLKYVNISLNYIRNYDALKKYPKLEAISNVRSLFKMPVDETNSREVTLTANTFANNRNLRTLYAGFHGVTIKELPIGLFRKNPNLDPKYIFDGARIKGYKPTPQELFGRPVNISFKELYDRAIFVD